MVASYTSSPSVVIVGGGLAGLTTAALLARAGRSVTLLERSSYLGGRAITKEQHGFLFNMGVHALYMTGPAEAVLRELDVPFSGRPSDRSIYEAHYAGRIHQLPTDPDSLRATSLLDTASRSELGQRAAKLEPDRRVALARREPARLAGADDHTAGSAALFRAAVRLATYTNAPELIDAGFALQLVGGRPAALLLDGGWQTLVDGLVRAARGAGARLITGARVAAIDPGEAGHLVRLADGSVLEADTVVLATEPPVAAQLVADGRHATLRRWAEQTQPVYAACLDLALRRLPNSRRLVVLHLDRPLYYSVHSRSSRLGPPDGALLHLIKYHAPGAPGDARADRQELEAWLDELQPGWRDLVVAQQFLPHIRVSGDMIQARRNGLAGRPGPAVPELHNLYVVGDWVGQEDHLANAGFASARQAVRQILSHSTITRLMWWPSAT